MLTTGLDDHRNPNGKKLKEGIEGGEDGRTHTRDFKRASYVVQTTLPVLPRGQQREMVECLLGSPPWPVVGRHHSKEGCGSETLLSCGNVDNGDDSANDDGWFRMNKPPLINKQRNACFR
jgi:hypothetical protein